MPIDQPSLERCQMLMDQSAAVCFATLDRTSPRLRALWNLRRHDRFPSAAAFCRRQGLTAYFATSVTSGKVRDIQANPAVSLYYCDADNVRGVTLAGRAEVVTEPALKRDAVARLVGDLLGGRSQRPRLLRAPRHAVRGNRMVGHAVRSTSK